MVRNRNFKIGLISARPGRVGRAWLTSILFALGFSLLSWVPWPAEKTLVKQFQDDALAEKYCPILIQADGIEPVPSHIYYRMAEDENRILIACHIAWPYERDERSQGLAAAWNKLFYTGGLKLQTKIFGPEDIEAIEIVLDKTSRKIIRIRYESASHRSQEKTGEEIANIEKPYFEVTTWNHMFELKSPEQANGKRIYQLKPEYFTDDLWDYYKIIKKRQTLFSQNRAHFEWEQKPGSRN